MKLLTLVTKSNRIVRLAMLALVVCSALLIVPIGQAHAAEQPTYDDNWCKRQFDQGFAGVYLFEHINYQGHCVRLDAPTNLRLETDNYYEFGRVGNDTASSIGIVGKRDVYLYEHVDRGGQWYHTTSSIPDLTTKSMSFGKNLNDVVSSLTIFDYNGIFA